jgi:hypothetical protein
VTTTPEALHFLHNPQPATRNPQPVAASLSESVLVNAFHISSNNEQNENHRKYCIDLIDPFAHLSNTLSGKPIFGTEALVVDIL